MIHIHDEMRFIIMLDIVDCNNTGPGEEVGTYTSVESLDTRCWR